MNGIVFVRAMEMSAYRSPLEAEVCPKCGKEGCTCGPECDCEPGRYIHLFPNRQKELVQDFEE